jgi:integrase/recombinase XerC
LINSFYNYLEFEKRYSPHTLEAYKGDISQYLDFLNQIYSLKDIRDSKPMHLRSWMVALHSDKISNRSINRKISALKTLFNFLRKRYGLDANPLRKIINPKVEKRLPLTVRKEHLNQLFATHATRDLEGSADSRSEWMAMRDELVIEILYSCGLRRSELMHLKIHDLDISRQLIKVKGKGNKERYLPVSMLLLSKIQQYLSLRSTAMADLGRGDHAFIFITDKGEPLYPKWVYNLVKAQLSLVTSIERKSPHILRHSFATHLSDAGADLNAVKTLLGHASLAATQVYMHNSIEKLKKVYDQAHPKS